MKTNRMKHLALTTIAAICVVSISQISIAQTTKAPANPFAGGDSSVAEAIKKLGNRIEALAYNGAQQVNKMIQAIDKNLPTIISQNTASITINRSPQPGRQGPSSSVTYNLSQAADVSAAYDTQQEVSHALASVASLASSDKKSPISKKLSVSQATTGTKASDSLTLSKQSAIFSGIFAAQNKRFQAVLPASPQELQQADQYFNFGSLFVPTNYTPEQLTTARRFVDYLLDTYKPVAKGVDFYKLKGQKPKVLNEIVNSSIYQNYQMSVRNTIANRSVAQSILNNLIAERTPMKDLSIAKGAPSVANSPYANVSSLEMQHRVATSKLHNKQWYQEMATAPPPVVAREMLFTLAEIQKQNYQAHLDRERILVALTALTAQSAKASAMLAQTEASKLNAVIKAATGANKDGGPGSDYEKYLDEKNLTPEQRKELEKGKSKLSPEERKKLEKAKEQHKKR